MIHSINRVGVGILSPLNVYNTKTPCNILEGAVGSAIGGIAGAIGQASANRANIQIARENNQANQQLAERQNKWNIDQWNRENEYNSASSQMQRLQKAGMNPYFSEVSAGSASSVQSADLANQHAAAPMGNVGEPIGRGLAAAGQSIFDSIMTQQLTAAQVKKANAEAVSAEAKANLDAANTSWLNDTKPDTIAGLQLKNQGMVQSNIGQGLSNQNMELRNVQQQSLNAITESQRDIEATNAHLVQKYGDKFKQAELDKLVAERGQIDSSTNVNMASIGKIASEITRNYAESNHLNADTQTINAIRGLVVKKMIIDNLGSAINTLDAANTTGLNLKYGEENTKQQLSTKEYENSFLGRLKSWVNVFGMIGGAALMYKGQSKGSTKLDKSKVTTEHFDGDDNLVKRIDTYTHNEYGNH